MERDVLPNLIEAQQIYVYDNTDFWRSIKNPGYVVTGMGCEL